LNRELIISSTSTGVDIALIEDGALVELHHEATDVPFQVGDVFAARIKKPAPSMNAVFVDIGSDKDAFLHYTDLGPQLQSLKKYVAAAINGKLAALNLQGFQLEADIIKNGKITDVLGKRDALLVQINKEPIGAKGSRLSSDITLAGRYIVLTPFSNVVAVSKKIKEDAERKRLQKIVESIKPANFGVIVRTAAEGRKVNEIHEDINAQVARWEGVTKMLRNANLPIKVMSELSKTVGILRDLLNESFNRIVVNDKEMYAEIKNFIKEIAPEKEKIVMLHTNNTPVFDQYKVTKQIKSSFGKNVSLSSGAYLVIEPTEAMHVIDVNSGNKMTVTGNQELNALTINLEAANEIARQLRLRDIGGIIVIDFIDLKDPANKKMLYRRMCELMENDRSRHTILPLSKFNVMQITRERTKEPVDVNVGELCPTCKGLGKVKSTMLLVEEIEGHLSYLLNELDNQNLRLVVHPFVEAYLKKGIQSRQWHWFWQYKKWIHVNSDSNLSLTDYRFYDSHNEDIKL
jgi:ribonuclease G